LKNDASSQDNNISKEEFQRLYYYPVQNEPLVYTRNPELMEISASDYYPPNRENFQDYSASVTTLPSAEDFEFEKLQPSDIKKVNATAINVEVESAMETKPNITQNPNLDAAGNPKYSKLLFSSHSATVTSNGPSGPFKAIICHDCDNSEGRNVGHSVSFSAIKSWNVGSSANKAAPSQDSNHTLVKESYPESGDATRVQAPDKYFDENQQIAMNDQVELYKVEQSVASETEKPIIPTNTWNYSHLPINNEHKGNPIAQKKPIFNDLLKVPYDVLNAPLTETPALETVKGTQIHINHQQKFNDTITSNYQHFQQFIHKNLKPSVMQQPPHYQSTPMPEQNYEIDESVSLMTNGRAHGVQTTTMRISSHVDDKNSQLPSNIPPGHEQDAKFGYVVEGRNFRKYRVEEKTADGFIVG
jgi:hypothetical protein